MVRCLYARACYTPTVHSTLPDKVCQAVPVLYLCAHTTQTKSILSCLFPLKAAKVRGISIILESISLISWAPYGEGKGRWASSESPDHHIHCLQRHSNFPWFGWSACLPSLHFCPAQYCSASYRTTEDLWPQSPDQFLVHSKSVIQVKQQFSDGLCFLLASGSPAVGHTWSAQHILPAAWPFHTLRTSEATFLSNKGKHDTVAHKMNLLNFFHFYVLTAGLWFNLISSASTLLYLHLQFVKSFLQFNFLLHDTQLKKIKTCFALMPKVNFFHFFFSLSFQIF